jgi:hypothetical protein
MLQAFFDETGTNPNTDTALVFGGFLGQADQWPLVSEAWNECLGSDPAIPHFSHRNCRNEKKLLDLATVISRFPLIGFCVYIRHKSIAARDASSMRGVAGTRPYDWVFRATIETVLEHIGAFHPSEKVDFTFDNRTELKVCIPYFYERKNDALISCYRHAGQCEPGDDKNSPALQMADLLAGEFNDCKKKARLSEPLRLILKTNGLIQGECAPPAAMNSLIAMNKRSKQIEKEGIELFREIKSVKTDNLPHDLAVRFHEFRQKSAFHDQQIAEHNERFKNDVSFLHVQSTEARKGKKTN